MSYFKNLPPTPDFPALEKEILAWWEKHHIENLYLHQNDKSDKRFSFLDGPITANNPMGVHHARGRTLKDLFQRYKNAQGFQQRFQNGFDCQGLWVEVEVEKDAGFNSKKDIQNFGLDKFTTACLNRVQKFSQIQTEQSRRLGMFMDWPNSYYTNSKTNNLYIWAFLKKIHQNGWLIKRQSAATWCPRCETGLSQHEQADGYQNITDTSVYLKFKLKNTKNEYLLVWTTTPWTLAANVLLAINTQFEYVKVKHNSEHLYLAKTSADRLGLTNYQLVNAPNLLDLEYESLFDIPAQANIRHFITNWNLVDPAEGTGIVHIAPGCGQEDFELGQTLNTPTIAPLDQTGHFLNGFGQLSGKYAHDVGDTVINYLKSINSLFKTENITHRYPHCWRCHTKCLFRLEDSWFIDCQQIRPLLKLQAAAATWIPKYIGRRMQNWLDTMADWMISRKRFYGLALPFYECSCGQLTVVGSLEELKSLAVDPKLIDGLPSLHRPWIDNIKIKCPKCGQEVKRISDVGDCWLDAGAVPFSTLKYFEDREFWQKWSPAEFICEMTEQVRLWYYSMLFFGVVFENKVPYQNVLNYNEVRDEKGERMSKTKKNGIPYDEAVDKMGADAMRWLYCQQKSHATVNFGYTIADQVKKQFLLILWNSSRFFMEHANLNSWSPGRIAPLNILDRWLLSRLHSTIKTVTHHLNRYHTSPATKDIESFVSDLSTWYIRRSRHRHDNYQLLSQVLDQLAILIAPFIPFVSEIIYQNLHQGQSSVHLQPWPLVDEKLINAPLETQMTQVRHLCQQIHALRQSAGLKIRQPLTSAIINLKLDNDLIDILQDEVNVKKIVFGPALALDTHLTPELKKEGECRDLVRNIQILRQKQQLTLTDKIKIFTPSWPPEFENEILTKTLAVSIEKSATLHLEKI